MNSISKWNQSETWQTSSPLSIVRVLPQTGSGHHRVLFDGLDVHGHSFPQVGDTSGSVGDSFT